MAFRSTLLAILVMTPLPMHAQKPVCDLFADLKSFEGRQVTLSGDLVIGENLAILGSPDCDVTQMYVADHYLWPAGVALQLTQLPPQYLDQYRSASAKILASRQLGKPVSATAILSGKLIASPSGDFPASLMVESIVEVKVEELPDAKDLPVVPICDLFQNLPSFKDKRIAVRAIGVGTSEGFWMIGDGRFQ